MGWNWHPFREKLQTIEASCTNTRDRIHEIDPPRSLHCRNELKQPTNQRQLPTRLKRNETGILRELFVGLKLKGETGILSFGSHVTPRYLSVGKPLHPVFLSGLLPKLFFSFSCSVPVNRLTTSIEYRQPIQGSFSKYRSLSISYLGNRRHKIPDPKELRERMRDASYPQDRIWGLAAIPSRTSERVLHATRWRVWK